MSENKEKNSLCNTQTTIHVVTGCWPEKNPTQKPYYTCVDLTKASEYNDQVWLISLEEIGWMLSKRGKIKIMIFLDGLFSKENMYFISVYLSDISVGQMHRTWGSGGNEH